MKKSNKLLISTILLALLVTGCVKPVQNTGTTSTPTYDNTSASVYSDGPIVYEDPATASTNNSIIYGDLPSDETVISTGTSYDPGVVVNPATTSGNGAYGNPYGSSSTTTYPDPYTSGNVGTTSSTSTSTYSGGGGIHLQVAALKDTYSAETFKSGLSLDPKYSAYVQQSGGMSKVIVTGFSSTSEAYQLRDRQFPGAFLVSGSSSSVVQPAYTPTTTSNDYTINNPYATSATTVTGSGIGVQIGAFSSQAKAQSVADNNVGQYPAIVKQGLSQGKTVYKVILTGFASQSAAKSAIASGQIPNGFVTNY